MAIYKPPNSRFWHASIYQGQGRKRLRVSLGVEDEETAKSLEATLRMARRGNVKRDTLISLIDDLIGYDENETGMQLSEAFSIYSGLPEVTVGEHTMRVRGQHFRRLVVFCEENWPRVKLMHHVTRHVAFDFADEEREKANKIKTYNNIKGNVQTVFQALMHRANLAENVWKLVPKLKATDALHGRSFTKAEEKRLLDAAQGTDWYAMSVIARYTGLRRKDIINLRWEHVKRDRITLMPSKTTRYKTVVRIPMHRKVKAALPNRRGPDEYVFPETHDKYTLGSSNTKSGFTDILATAKIPAAGAHLTFHCWRHTFRTRLSEARVSQEIVKALAGWKTDDMAELYNHDWSIMREAIDAL